MRVEVEGLDELRRALRKLGDTELPKGLKQANKSAAQLVVDAALPHVPVGPTGRLKKSVRALASQREARVKAGGARVPYAAAVHWGTRARPGLRGPHNIARRPFIYEAAARVRDRAMEEYVDVLQELMDEVIR